MPISGLDSLLKSLALHSQKTIHTSKNKEHVYFLLFPALPKSSNYLPFFTISLLTWTSCNTTQVVSNKLLWKQNKCEIYLAFQILKKAILLKKYQGPQLPFWNTKLLPTTQGSHSRRWLRPFHTFCEAQIFAVQHVHFIVDTIKAYNSENTEKMGFPPNPWGSMVLLHTNRILQFLLHAYLCMFVRFGVFSPPFLSLKKMKLFLSSCDQWKTIYSGVEVVKCEKDQVTSWGPFQTGLLHES